jgi:hypothetical protein
LGVQAVVAAGTMAIGFAGLSHATDDLARLLAEVGATGVARSMDGLATGIGGWAAQDKSPQT